MKIKNIVIINDFNYIQGGASKVAIETAKVLANEKDLNVYFFYAVHQNTNIINNVKYICTNQNEALKEKNKLIGSINGIYNKSAKKKLKELLKDLNPDDTILHIHGWTKALSSSVFDIAFKMKFKVVLTLHDYFMVCPNGGFYNYKKSKICDLKPLSLKCVNCNCDSRNYIFKIYRNIRTFVQNKIVQVPKKINCAITISSLSENILKSYLNESVKIERIYNPIDIDEVKQKDNSRITKEDYYLFVGRLDKEKGIEEFCKAITETNEKAIVVGTGKLKKKLEEKYKNINFVGWKKSFEVYKYLEKAKALIFPSLWYETAGLTVLEAQILNVPCIVNSNTAATEFIIENVTGKKYQTYNELVNIIKEFDSLKFNFEKNNINKINYKEYLSKLLKCYERIMN